MTKSCEAVWDGCLKTIRKSPEVNDQGFKTWFAPIKPKALHGSQLTIQVPNNFFYEYLEEHYITVLRNAIQSELGDQAQLKYQILTPREQKNVAPSVQNGSTIIEENKVIKNPFVIPGLKKVKIEHQLNPSYLFTNFIEGDCNKLARSAGLAISKNPGGTAFNPLFVYGNVGLGKTHLAQAIGNEIIQRFPDKTVLYISTEKFTNQIIHAIRNNSVNDLVQFYLMVDVLLVDDIQFLANKTKTQEIFFYIFNQLHQASKQLVITSDRAPKDMDGMEERLLSRFKWGLTADLQAPDYETRMAILTFLAEKNQMEVPFNVLEFIAMNVEESIREMEGIMTSIFARASLTGQTIDLQMAKMSVQSSVQRKSQEITIENITELVADFFNIPVERIQGKTRKRNVVVARQLSMALAKKMTDSSLKSIGQAFGGKDHSTVIYSCKTVNDLMDTDDDFRDMVQELEKKIQFTMHSGSNAL